MIGDCFGRVGRTAPERSFAMTVPENVKALVIVVVVKATLDH